MSGHHIRLRLFQSHTDRKTEREVLPLNPISHPLARVREQHLSIIMIVPHWPLWWSYLWCFAGRPSCFLCFPADCSNGWCCSINETLRPMSRNLQKPRLLPNTLSHHFQPVRRHCWNFDPSVWFWFCIWINSGIIFYVFVFWAFVLPSSEPGSSLLRTSGNYLHARIWCPRLSLCWDYRIFRTIRRTGL